MNSYPSENDLKKKEEVCLRQYKANRAALEQTQYDIKNNVIV